MPAEVIEGVQRDIDVWRALDAGRVNPSFHVHLGQVEARQLVSEAILACERFDEWRVALAPSTLPQLHVLSRVAALLLSAGASEKPPAAVVQAAKEAYDRAPVDVEAASMGGQCCEPYAAEVDEVSEELQRAYDQRDAAQRRAYELGRKLDAAEEREQYALEQARVWSDASDRERARAKATESEMRRLMGAGEDARNVARAAETRFGELLGRVAEAEREMCDAVVRWQAGASRLSGGTPAQERAGARADAFATAATLRRIRKDYES